MNSEPFVGQAVTDIVGANFEIVPSALKGVDTKSAFNASFSNAAAGQAVDIAMPAVKHGFTARYTLGA